MNSVKLVFSLHNFVSPHSQQFDVTPSTSPLAGFDLPRKIWVTLNRFRTGLGKCYALYVTVGFL